LFGPPCIRLGVKATTCKAKAKAKAKDLTFKANGLIPEANVGYRKNYKSEKLEYAAKGHGLTQLHALVQPITRRTA